MSWFEKTLKKAKGLVVKGAQVLPGIAQVLPGSKALQTAAGTLQRTAAVIQGGGIMSPPLVSTKAGALSFGPTSGGALPPLPPPGGSAPGFIKTGLPVLAAAGVARAAPVVAAGVRGLLARVSPKVAKALGWVTIGGLVYDAAGNLQGKVKRRTMNPLNPKAAKRAIRRIKGVRKVCSSIERQLPKQKARGCAPRRAPCR